MAFYDTTIYCNYGNGTSTGYYAVTVRPQNTAVAAGVLRRQFTAPAVGSERVFVCIVAGTTANTTDATWTVTRGAKTTDGTATWQECTGLSAVNGDLTNTPTWTQAKAIGNPTLGAIIQRNNGASYWICSTAGTLGASEPAWSNNTAGTTQADNTVTWTCLGVVGNFTGGQAPHARLAAAGNVNWYIGTAGTIGTIYVGANHAESQGATMNTTIVTGSDTLGRIICHNQSGSYPPTASDITTGATISTAGAFNITLTLAWFYIYGLTFKAGVGSSTSGSITIKTASGSGYTYCDNCSFQIASTASTPALTLGLATSSYDTFIWNNCTVSFGHANQGISPLSSQFFWRNTGTVLVGGSTVPSRLILPPASTGLADVVLEALDLSQISTQVWGNTVASQGTVLIKDCKLHASATIATPLASQLVVQVERSDSGATAYKSSRYLYEGTETTETSITRVGGAVDPSGQAQSRKIVTSAFANFLLPFQAEPYAIWNTTTGANVTVTIYGTINAGAVPTDGEIWMEVLYLGSTSQPLGTVVKTAKANFLSTAAAVNSDGSSWNGGGSGAGWSPFKLTTTLSSPQPGMAGYIDVRVRAAKASTTYYVDPKIELT